MTFHLVQWKFGSRVVVAKCSKPQASNSDIMFEVPSQEDIKRVRITKAAVDGTGQPILEIA